ncbi:MAG: DUF4974 domain-containing protein [Gemmatimonas sp.]|nr:DUF4974 domain-containing protein [Gemmatimonas sp.]
MIRRRNVTASAGETTPRPDNIKTGTIALMDEIICRSVRRLTSPAEEAELLRWRRESMQNERYFRDLTHVLEEAREVEEQAAVPVPPTGRELLGRRAQPRSRPIRSTRRRIPRWAWQFGVASVAVGAFTSLVLSAIRPSADSVGSVPFEFGTGEVVTGAAEAVTVKLGDGTIVRLAPESRLRMMGQTGRREVWMDGRAFFAVTKVEDRPFVVRTHAGAATVLGTRFDLAAREGDLQLLVVDGSVNVAAQGASLDVTAKQSARASASAPPVRMEVDSAYINSELAWLGDFLVFEGTSLSQVASELSAHYGVPVEVLDDDLAHETVVGVFSDQTLEDVMEFICRAISAHCSFQPSRVTISP